MLLHRSPKNTAEFPIIKTGDAGNRAGAIFEMLALNLFEAAGNKIVTSKENNPGYDGIVELKDDASLIVSLKNHGKSSSEKYFIERAIALDHKYQGWLRQQSLNVIEVRIIHSENLSASDWIELEDDLRCIIENIKHKPPTEIATGGRWHITLMNVDAKYLPLSGNDLTSSFFICAREHRNEQLNFIENIRKGWWILTRSATPWDARAHQGKIGFSFPLHRLPLHFEMRRRLRGKENRVGSKRWGVTLRVGNQGANFYII